MGQTPDFDAMTETVKNMVRACQQVNRAIEDGRFKFEDLTREVEKKRRPWLIHDIGERMIARKRAALAPSLPRR